jgi:hypothetical protein
MTETRIPVSEALGEAMDFARAAWRDAWAPMAFVAVGWALIIVGGHAQLTDADAGLLQKIGIGLLLFHIPLLGSLYRLGLGGRPYRGLAIGGLQLGGVEWRVLAVNAVILFFFVLACAPLLLASGVLYMLLRRFDGLNLGPLGHLEWWFLVATPLWIGLFIWLIYSSGRLSMATPISIERKQVTPWQSWELTPGYGRVIAAAFLLAHIPTLLVWLALQAFGWIEPDASPIGLHGAWPLPEAVGAGLLAGVALSVVQAPISVGLLICFYDLLAPFDEATQAAAPARVEADGAVTAVEEDASAAPMEADSVKPEPEPEPDPPFSTVELSADTGRYTRIAAPWLSEETMPAIYRSLAPAPEHDPDPAVELEPGLESQQEHHLDAEHPPELEEAVEVERRPDDEPAEQTPPGDAGAVVEEEHYPHSAVEYSAQTGRFSHLPEPELVHEPPRKSSPR